MRIGIDARFYGPYVGGGGLGRYTSELLTALEEIDTENRYLIFLNAEGFHAYQPRNPRFEKRLADVRWYTLAEQLRMPRLIDSEHLDFIHYPHWNVPLLARTPFLTTIHDLILLDERNSAVRATTLSRPLYFLKRLGYRLALRHAILGAKHVIAVSDFTRGRILKHFPRLLPKHVTTIYEGTTNVPKGSNIAHPLIPKSPYFLYVGNAYPHKNLESLLHAFSFFVKEHPETKLVLIGRESVFYDRLKKELSEIDVPASSVVFPGFVADENLGGFYEHATLYLFPSRHEGFGLPPLEAMKHGVPVAAARTTSLPEILGDAALYFDPNDLEEMVRVMETALSDESLRQELTKKGFEQADRYDWKTMAEQTLELYQQQASH